MFEAEKEYDALLADKTLPWKLCYDSKKKGQELTYEQAVSSRGMQILRVKCQFDHSPMTVLKAYTDRDTRIAYDDNIKESAVVKYLGASMIISMQETHKIAVIAPRDVFLHIWVDIKESGIIKIVTHDLVDYP